MKKSFFLIVCIVLFASCGKNPTQGEGEVVVPIDEKIPITISTELTKATDTAFENGDKIGLFVVNRNGGNAGTLVTSGNHADNVAFTFNDNVWASSTQLYWKDQQTHADFYCYYPHKNTITNVNAIPFEVQTDQSSSKKYFDSELLWGKTLDAAPSTDPVRIICQHELSNLLIYLRAGNGYSQETLLSEVESLRINNTLVHGTLNLVSGTVSPTGDPADITPFNEGDHYRAMIVPQTVNNTTLVSLVVDGYSFSLRQSITFLGNKQHKCTITVNKTSEGINIGIGEWEVDETDYGGVIN